MTDIYYMRLAFAEAEKAYRAGEIPVGAVVVAKDTVIARSHNLTEALSDPTAHAEMQAITAATSWLGGKYLTGCSLYVTLEPCTMCAGALFWSRVSELIYGCSDPRRGFSLNERRVLHPATTVRKGIMEEECAALLQRFFLIRR